MKIRYNLLLLILFAFKINAAPVAVTDNRSVPMNTAISIDVLSNDYDTDSGRTLRLDPTGLSTPSHGTVTFNNEGGGITYTPNANSLEPDSFTYTLISEGLEVVETATGTVFITLASAQSVAPGSNIRSVVSAISGVCSAISAEPGVEQAPTSLGASELSARCQAWVNLSEQDPEAANLVARIIAPEETLAVAQVGTNASRAQANIVGARLSQLGNQLSNIAANGIAWSTQAAGGAAGDNAILAKIGFFASLQLEDANKKTTQPETGFDAQALSVTAGVDYALNQDWFVGAALGLSNSDLKFEQSGGTIKSDVVTFIAYNTYGLGNFNLDLQAGISNSEIDIARRINYETPLETVDTTTAGNTSGNQWFVSTQIQYLYSYKGLSLFPSIKYLYMDSGVDGYADNNASGWEVILGEQNLKKNTLELGLQATYAMNTGWGVFVPNIEFQAFDDLDTDQEITLGRFAFASDETIEFGFYGEAPDALYYQVGLGFSMVFPRGTSAFAGYRKILGHSDYSANQVQAGFRMEF